MITKMADFESEESVFLSLSSVWQEKNCYGENFRYQENICEIGRAGGCCSNREPPDQIGRVGIIVLNIFMAWEKFASSRFLMTARLC